MIYYYDPSGKLLYKSESIKAMSAYTGVDRKTIMRRLEDRESRMRRKGSVRALIPYFERDALDDTTRDGLNSHFLRLYFAGRSNEEIMDILEISEKELYKLYRYLIGIDIEPAEAIEKCADMTLRKDFWDEWHAITSHLVNSGADLNVPITYKQFT